MLLNSFVVIFLIFQFTTAQEPYLLNNFAEIKKDTLGKNHHFFISKYAVTVLDYKNYLNFQGLQLPEPPNYGWEQTNLPMVSVSFKDFVNYCNWLEDYFKIKFRAPTNLEWTIAASNQENPLQKLSLSQPQEVDVIRPNKYGISGMNGNVWEWTSSKIDKNYHIIRGSSYLEDNHPDTLNVNKIESQHPSSELEDVGFRLVIDASEMHKYLFAQKVATILQQLFPEYINLNVDAQNLYINDGFIRWDHRMNPLKINYKKYYLQFTGIQYSKDSKENYPTSEKFYFDKKDKGLVSELERLLKKELKEIYK